MYRTLGIHHLGLSVQDLDLTVRFFVDCLGWEESARDESYPRAFVSDGTVLLTLWQVDHDLSVEPFHFRKNVGLHHVALELATEETLHEVAERVSQYPGVVVEFMPELLGDGPRMHMIFAEPGGIRMELIWSGL